MKKFFVIDTDGSVVELGNPQVCSFGITEAIAGVVSFLSATAASTSAAIAGGLGELGVGSATAGILGQAGVGVLEGGLVGALTNPKNPLKGAEFGGITGGVFAGGGALLSNLSAPAASAGGSAASAAAPASVGAPSADATLGQGANWMNSVSQTGATAAPAGSSLNGAVGAATGGTTGNWMSSVSPTGANMTGAAPGGGTNFMNAVSPTGQNMTGSTTGTAQSPTGTSSGGLSSATGSFMNGTGDAGGSLANAATPGAVGAGSATGIPTMTANIAPAAGGGAGDFFSALETPKGLLNLGALGVNMLMGNREPAGYGQLKSEASHFTSEGNQLQSYLRAGTLPPGAEAGMNAAKQAALAAVRQQYAAAGMSGASSEQQDLQNVGIQIQAKSEELAQQLFEQGVKESEFGQQLYMELMQINMQQDQNFASAIGNFTSSMAMMGASQPTVH